MGIIYIKKSLLVYCIYTPNATLVITRLRMNSINSWELLPTLCWFDSLWMYLSILYFGNQESKENGFPDLIDRELCDCMLLSAFARPQSSREDLRRRFEMPFSMSLNHHACFLVRDFHLAGMEDKLKVNKERIWQGLNPALPFAACLHRVLFFILQTIFNRKKYFYYSFLEFGNLVLNREKNFTWFPPHTQNNFWLNEGNWNIDALVFNNNVIFSLHINRDVGNAKCLVLSLLSKD